MAFSSFPVFVGSTFADLVSYRSAVLGALQAMELVARGMEHFGARPGSPVDECLSVVRSCRIYVGIFGMRYGSVPHGHTRSITHLEYDEAQRMRLASLIYLLDEDRQPVLPKHVETGDGAERLRMLKAELTKSHTIARFTSEEDLVAKICADLPRLLNGLSTGNDSKRADFSTDPDAGILCVRTHRAAFNASPSTPHYFINIVNMSPDRTLEVTHVYYELNGQHVPVNQASRPLPVRLRPEESWETWIDARLVPALGAFEAFFVRISTGAFFSSVENLTVPPVGTVPGGPIELTFKRLKLAQLQSDIENEVAMGLAAYRRAYGEDKEGLASRVLGSSFSLLREKYAIARVEIDDAVLLDGIRKMIAAKQ